MSALRPGMPPVTRCRADDMVPKAEAEELLEQIGRELKSFSYEELELLHERLPREGK